MLKNVILVCVGLILTVHGAVIPELTSNALTFMKDAIKLPQSHVRVRRAVTLSEEEKQAIVDIHNSLRRQEGSSDMQEMVSCRKKITKI